MIFAVLRGRTLGAAVLGAAAAVLKMVDMAYRASPIEGLKMGRTMAEAIEKFCCRLEGKGPRP